jgi:hypothetical protein
MSLGMSLDRVFQDLKNLGIINISNLAEVKTGLDALEKIIKFSVPNFDYHILDKNNPHKVRADQLVFNEAGYHKFAPSVYIIDTPLTNSYSLFGLADHIVLEDTNDVGITMLTDSTTLGSQSLMINMGNDTDVDFFSINASMISGILNITVAGKTNFQIDQYQSWFNPFKYDVDFQVSGQNDSNALYVDASADSVGVGTATPDGTLHVHTASAGTVTASGDGDDLVVENNGNVGLSLLCPDASVGRLIYGSPTSNNNVALEYITSADTMRVLFDTTTEVIRFSLSGSGAVVINEQGNDQDLRVEGTGDTNLIRTDAANDRVGIGTALPSYKLSVGGSNIGLDNTYYIAWKNSASANRPIIGFTSGNNLQISLSTDAGYLSKSYARTNSGESIINSDTNGDGISISLGDATNNLTTNNDFMLFYDRVGATNVGSIDSDGAGNTRYNTTSDMRLKNTIVPAVNQLEKIKQLGVKEYERNIAPGRKEIGLIAQEVFPVYPNAVAQPKNKKVEVITGYDDEGMPIMEEQNVQTPWMIDYTKLIPMLIAGLQELEQRVTNLGG